MLLVNFHLVPLVDDVPDRMTDFKKCKHIPVVGNVCMEIYAHSGNMVCSFKNYANFCRL